MEDVQIVASYKNWSVSLIVQEESSVSQLKSGNNVIAYADHTYELLLNCPPDIAVELRKLLIDYEIKAAGGISSFREQVYNNQLTYGVGCYNYLDTDTLRAFAELDIYLSHKI